MNWNAVMNTLIVLGLALLVCIVARWFGIELDPFKVGVFIFLGIGLTYLAALNHNVIQSFYFIFKGGKDGDKNKSDHQ